MFYKKGSVYKNYGKALAGVAPWFEHWPMDLMVGSSIPGQGTCLGCGPGPHLGVYKRKPISFFPFLSSSFPSTLKINK